MIIQALHTSPTALDREQHRQTKLQLPVTDWSVASRLNALFVAAVEFGDVAREYPIVFIRAGKGEDGKDLIASIAVLGMVTGQNLYQNAGQWRATYMPAVLRCYPFCIGRLDNTQFAICVDTAWAGVNTTEGDALFNADGQATELLQNMQKHLEALETEVQRTRMVGQRLLDLDVLKDMRFDATLPDGRQHSVDGFLTVDEAKMQALPDEVVGQLHREGVLGLVHAHWVSLGHMRRMVEWHAEREAAQLPQPAQA